LKIVAKTTKNTPNPTPNTALQLLRTPTPHNQKERKGKNFFFKKTNFSLRFFKNKLYLNENIKANI